MENIKKKVWENEEFMELNPEEEFPKKKKNKFWKNQISGNSKFQVEEKQKNPGKNKIFWKKIPKN